MSIMWLRKTARNVILDSGDVVRFEQRRSGMQVRCIATRYQTYNECLLMEWKKSHST